VRRDQKVDREGDELSRDIVASPTQRRIVSQGMGAITDVRERDRDEAARMRQRLKPYRRARLIENAPFLAASGAVVAMVGWVVATR
jgi:hypothetical protein